jgi:hypothetical protein
MFQMAKKIPNACKIFQMAMKYFNIFRSKALQNLPKLVFLVLKRNQPATLLWEERSADIGCPVLEQKLSQKVEERKEREKSKRMDAQANVSVTRRVREKTAKMKPNPFFWQFFTYLKPSKRGRQKLR